ncbi:hypothetical protein GCM10010174_42530 [Kutzneria viridogrisea]
MPRREDQGLRVARERGAEHEVRLVHRSEHERGVHLAPAHGAERVGQRQFDEFQVAGRVLPTERAGQLAQRLVEHADEPQSQHPEHPARGGPRLLDHPVQTGVGGPQLGEEPRAERGRPHPPAGPVEQPRAEPVLQGAQQLADPPLGEVEPLGGPPEVQFLAQHQCALQFAQVQSGHVVPLIDESD